MPIIESIQIARKRGATEEQILQEIIRQNPGKAQTFIDALKRGVSAAQIIENIIRERMPKAFPLEKKEKPLEKTEEEIKLEEAKKRIEALKKEAEERAKRRREEMAKEELLKEAEGEKEIEKEELKTYVQPAPARTGKRKLLEGFLEKERETTKISPFPTTPPVPPQPPRPVEIIRPVPGKPSTGAKLWIRFLIFSLVLVVLAGFATFWYWYLVIRVRPPLPSPSPSPGPGPGPSPSPGPGPEIIIPSSLFSTEDTREISISSSQELQSFVQQTIQEWQETDQFRRIVIKNTTENKVLGLKDFFDALLIRVPTDLYQKIENDFTLFVYSQNVGNRLGFATKIKNSEGLENLLKSQEPTMEADFKGYFDLVGKEGPAIVSYFRDAVNVRGYVGPNFRYQTLSRNDLSICYLVSSDYFILTSSWESMKSTINRLGISGKPIEITQELKSGSFGDEVKLLQLWLKQDPVIYPEGKVTGRFGSLTESAVIRFQEKYASEILAPQGFTKGTGIVDLYTRVKLNELYGKSGIILPTTELITDLRYGDHGVEVKLLQTWLAKDKNVYPAGVTSGWFGYLTQQAVIRFQEKYASEILAPQGLKRGTGIVDALTRKKLIDLYGK